MKTILAAAFIFVFHVRAQHIVNGGFQHGDDPGVSVQVNAVDDHTIHGWTVTSGSVDYVGTRWGAQINSRCLDLSGDGAGVITQTMRHLQPGELYTLRFLLSANPEDGEPHTLRVEFGVGSATFTYPSEANTKRHMHWQPITIRFAATAEEMPLVFASTDDFLFGPVIDRVRVTHRKNSASAQRNGARD